MHIEQQKSIEEALTALADYLESATASSNSAYTIVSSEHLHVAHRSKIYEHFRHPLETSYRNFHRHTGIHLFERIHRRTNEIQTHVIKFMTYESPALLRSYITATFTTSTTTHAPNVPSRPTRTRRIPQRLDIYTQEHRRNQRRRITSESSAVSRITTDMNMRGFQTSTINLQLPSPSLPSLTPLPPNVPLLQLLDRFVKKIHEPNQYRFCYECKERKRSSHIHKCQKCTKDIAEHGFSLFGYQNDMDPFYAPSEEARARYLWLIQNNPLTEIEQVRNTSIIH